MAGHPTYDVNVIKIKWEILWTGGLPYLPGVPHLHVNRSLFSLTTFVVPFSWVDFLFVSTL